MARRTGLHRRRDSRFWWFKVVLPNGQRLRASTGTEDREEAGAYLAKLQHEAYRAGYLGRLRLNDITGDVIWSIVEGESKKGNKPATINRALALVRSILRMAHFDWRWIDAIPRVRLLAGEVERDRWLEIENDG